MESYSKYRWVKCVWPLILTLSPFSPLTPKAPWEKNQANTMRNHAIDNEYHHSVVSYHKEASVIIKKKKKKMGIMTVIIRNAHQSQNTVQSSINPSINPINWLTLWNKFSIAHGGTQ